MDSTSPTGTSAVSRLDSGRAPGNGGLFLIAVFEVFKAVLFVIGAAIVFHMVKRDTNLELLKILHAFRVSGDRAFLKDLLLRANVISDPAKRIVSGVMLLYAVLHATEGIGLLLRKRWAEYFTVIMTALPIVFEFYWLVHHTANSKVVDLSPRSQQIPALFSQHVLVLKVIVLLSNVAIVWYLVYHLRKSSGHHTSAPLLANDPVEPAKL